MQSIFSVSRKVFLLYISVFLCLLTLALPGVLSAQSLNLTPEQIAQLQAMTPEQRQALLQGLGGSADSTGTVQPATPAQTTVTATQDAGVIPRAASATAGADQIEQNAQQVQGTEQLAEDVEQPTTPEPLRQFGYELFAGTPTTFAPANNIPVPLNYVVGPSDTVIMQLYGQRNARYEVQVTREGTLEFPEIGPLNVAGLTFEQMRELIETTVATSLIGQQVSVTMGALRSIQIFVLGEAFRPGSYTVSSLSTMTNALFSSGGVTRVGSLRDIRLMRQGELITSLDLYDLLLRGDTSGDVRLQPNDVIFIPTIGSTVGIAGEVRRPAIFELKDETTITDVLPLSGGNLPTAFPAASRIERINEQGERTLLDVDLTQAANLTLNVRDGDVLQIYSILDQVEGVVLLEGHVNRPGGFAWREGIRVTDILSSVGDMLPNPDLDYALIAREQQPNRTLEILYVNLRQALANSGAAADFVFEPRDRFIVFGAAQGRQAQLTELLSTLRTQETFDAPAPIVSIDGNVNFPGQYPLSEGLTASDLIRFAGGLGDNAYLGYLVLEREIDNQGNTTVEALSLDNLTMGTTSPISLQAGDNLLVFNANAARTELLGPVVGRLQQQTLFQAPAQVVEIAGNVRFPGPYPQHQGMTVGDLVNAAGGFTEESELNYVVLERETDAFGRIDVLTLNLADSNAADAQRSLNPQDRLIVFNANQPRSELLQPTLDSLVSQARVDEPTQIANISGDVRFPGQYPLSDGLNVADLIRAAGGLTQSAETREAEITRFQIDDLEGREAGHIQINLLANGIQGRGEILQPFDTLIIRRLPNWTEIETVTVSGEVRSPGNYVIRKDETISQLIARAGGLSPYANPRAAIFLREDLRENEQALITEFRERLRQAMLAQSMTTSTREVQPAISAEMFNELLSQVAATGRLVIDLPLAIGSPGSDLDVTLKSGDQLLIPTFNQEITVLGEVQRPTSHLYERNLAAGDYINKSGGLTQNANNRGIYVIKASGEVIAYGSSRWFFEGNRNRLEPGDSIVVPFDIKVSDPLYILTSVSQILFNMATTVLAIDTVRD